MELVGSLARMSQNDVATGQDDLDQTIQKRCDLPAAKVIEHVGAKGEVDPSRQGEVSHVADDVLHAGTAGSASSLDGPFRDIYARDLARRK